MAINKKPGNATPDQTSMGDAFQQAYQQAGQQPPPQQQQVPPQQQQYTQPPPQQQQYNNPPPPQQPPPPVGRRGVMEVNTLMRRPMSRKSTGEVVTKYKDVLVKQMGVNFKEGFENAFRLLVLDNNSANVGPLSSILVCYNEKYAGQYYTAVYTLLIEGSSAALNSRIINIGGRNVEIDVVAGDVYNNYLWATIQAHVKASYGTELNILEAGQMVLPRELNPEDEEHLRRVIFNATQACFTIMERALGNVEHVFTIADVDQRTESLIARLDYNPGDAESATGEPIRSDVRIALQGNIARNAEAGGFEQVRELVVVDGYLDLTYCPPPLPIPGQMPVTQYYYPRFVITRADTAVDAITMELQLLALYQSTLLNRNMSWSGVYRQRHHIKGTDTRDIGAIGWEINLSDDPQAPPKRVDTKAKSFGDQQLYQLITQTIWDRLLYSMDIEEVGELSWIHQAFIASPSSKEAYDLVLEAADKLTLGFFKTHFVYNTPICYDDYIRVHLGYYVDEEGIRRDLRNLDYLALLNIVGKDDPRLVIDWAETYDNVDMPIELRLEKRAGILRTILGSTLRIKGYARRITFNPAFMIALNTSCVDAGLVVRPNNLIQDFSGVGVRGSRNAGQYAVNPQQMQGGFVYGQNRFGDNRNGMNQQFTGMYGRTPPM